MTDRKVRITAGDISGAIVLGDNAYGTGAGGNITVGSVADMAKILAAVRANLATVPEDRRVGVETLLKEAEAEGASASPDRGKIRVLLKTIGGISQGVIGSLIANAIS